VHTNTFRLDLNFDEYLLLHKGFNFNNITKYLNEDEAQKEILSNLLNKMNNPKKIKTSHKKTTAALKAQSAKQKQSKRKIQNAINLLRLEGKKINAHSIAQTANISYNTAKKYKNIFEGIK